LVRARFSQGGAVSLLLLLLLLVPHATTAVDTNALRTANYRLDPEPPRRH